MGVADRSMQEGLRLQRLKHSSGRNRALPSSSRKRQQLRIHQPVGNSFTIAQQLVIALEWKMDRRIHGWGSKLDEGSLCTEAQSLQGCRLRRVWCSITNCFAQLVHLSLCQAGGPIRVRLLGFKYNLRQVLQILHAYQLVCGHALAAGGWGRLNSVNTADGTPYAKVGAPNEEPKQADQEPFSHA